MSNQIGVNTIGKSERPSLLAGDFPRVTAAGKAAVDLPLGAVIGGGDFETGLTPWASATTPPIAVAAEPIAAGEEGTFWLSGEFIGDRCSPATGSESDWAAYWPTTAGIQASRPYNLYFKTARLAPNQ